MMVWTIRQARRVLGAGALLLLAGCGAEPAPLWPGAQARPPVLGDPQRGRLRIAEHGCISCHTVPGVRGPASSVGPPLRRVAARAYLGGVLPNTPGNMVRWLLDPPAVDPRTAMPNVGLSEADAADIAAYLLTLH